MIVIPNLIIAGAPKCGSTSLHHYLADHPSVCASIEQESRFLMDEGYPLYQPEHNIALHGLEGYKHFFPSYESARHRVVLDTTPDYLYQETALRTVREMPSAPSVLFLLRKPSRRIYSLFRFAQNNVGVLDEGMTFADFVARVRNGGFPAERVILRQAFEHSDYATYIARWIEAIGRDNIHVLLFEDMARDPEQFMSRLARQCGIDRDFYSSYDFGIANRTLTVKSRRLHFFKRWLKKRKLGLGWLGPLQSGARQLFWRSTYKERQSLLTADELQLLTELEESFRASKANLTQLTGISLSSWD